MGETVGGQRPLAKDTQECRGGHCRQKGTGEGPAYGLLPYGPLASGTVGDCYGHRKLTLSLYRGTTHPPANQSAAWKRRSSKSRLKEISDTLQDMSCPGSSLRSHETSKVTSNLEQTGDNLADGIIEQKPTNKQT